MKFFLEKLANCRDAVSAAGCVQKISQICATGVVTIAFAVAAQAASGQASYAVSNASPARTETALQTLDASAFEIVAERNIFNANRSGGQVRVSSSRRPTRIETFTLVGTMAYEKGVFAFFEGSSSELSKVLKSNGVIAGHKLVDILANSVKLEADGKQFELPIGLQMRREDEGTWHMAEASVRSGGESANYVSNRESESNGRSSRSSRSDSGRYDYSSRRRGGTDSGSSNRNDRAEPTSQPGTTNSGLSEAEILKRLQERREKE
jgi:hypothetical protein